MYLYRARTQTKVSGLCQPDMSFMEIKPQHMLQFYKPWLQKYLCTARTVVQPKLQRHCSRGQGCVQSRQYESECRQRKTQDMVFESFRIPQFITSCYFWYVYTHINTHLYTHTVYIYICVYVFHMELWYILCSFGFQRQPRHSSPPGGTNMTFSHGTWLAADGCFRETTQNPWVDQNDNTETRQTQTQSTSGRWLKTALGAMVEEEWSVEKCYWDTSWGRLNPGWVTGVRGDDVSRAKTPTEHWACS